MLNIKHLEQIGAVSNKISFLYNLHSQKFDFLSKTIESVFGDSLDNIRNNPALLVKDISNEDFSSCEKLYNRLLQGEQVEGEFIISGSGFTPKRLRVTAYPVRDADQKIIAITGIGEDIGGQSEYLEYLMEFGRKKNAALEILAHDLLGPLAMMSSIVDALEHEYNEKMSEEIQNYTRFIKNACLSCTNLVNDILSEEHLLSPKIQLNLTKIDLVKKVREVVEYYNVNKIITQQFQIIADAPVLVDVDIVKIDQVLNNLISNSIKFTQPDGIITITIKEEEEGVLLIHHDNGIGIPIEDQPYLFDRYTRAARNGLLGEKSVGIGMSIVKELVELHGAQIWFDSKEQEGTSFYIMFPLATKN